MDDGMSFLEFMGWFFLALVALIGVISWVISVIENQEDDEIRKIGYNPISVRIYLEMVNMDANSFIHSGGLRKQYENFEAGKLTLQKQKDPKNPSTTGAFVGGVIVGSILD